MPGPQARWPALIQRHLAYIAAMHSRSISGFPLQRSFTNSRRIAFLAVMLTPFLTQCGESKPPAPPPPPATFAKPVQRTIVDQDEYVGRFVAVNSVEIRARVSGYLEEIHFR